MAQQEQNKRLGIAAALAAFGTWGLVPIYFKWLSDVPALEIIIHRILWSIPILIIFLLVRDGRKFFSKMVLPPKIIAALLLSGFLVATNWLAFVWAVTNDQILETSLGYFINPLVSVVLGMVFLKERLTRTQLAAVVLAASGTAYLAWFLGQPPWISLTLALSFGFYGLVRKQLSVGPMTGLLWEALLLSIPAFGALAWLHFGDGLHFGSHSLSIDWLLVGTGLLTILPLVWFNTAAQNLPLTTVGFFQYMAPTITFLLAVFVYNEPFTQGYAVAFGCIWLSLALVSVESAFKPRRARMP